MLNRKKLTVAIAIAVGTSAAALSAQAGQLFFPQSAVSDSVTTIFSVINTEGNRPGVPGRDELHYRYYYKVYAPTGGDAESDQDAFNEQYCEETNAYLPTSKYDIQTIDIAGNLSDGVNGVLFNDPSRNNNWMGSDFAMARTVGKPHRGYLIVEHPAYVDGVDSSTMGLYGEAIIFEFGSGAAWGYQGFHKAGVEGMTCDFSGAASNSPSHVAVFPFAEDNFSTRFMVTPLYRPDGVADVCPDDDNWNYATIELEASSEYGNNVVMFDRDENPVSGATPKDVVCVGAIDAKNLINDGTQSRVADGGWTGVWNYASGGGVGCSGGTPSCSSWDEDEAAVVFKLEYGLTSAINGGAPGVYNNAIYLHPGFNWGGRVGN